jgi:hypothetical protein
MKNMQKFRISLEGEGVESKIYEWNCVPRIGEDVVIFDALRDEHCYTIKWVSHNFCCPLDGLDAPITLGVELRRRR